MLVSSVLSALIIIRSAQPIPVTIVWKPNPHIYSSVPRSVLSAQNVVVYAGDWQKIYCRRRQLEVLHDS